MFWLQTITHVQVHSILELWFPIIHHKIEVALAGLPEPQSDDFIKFGMEIVSLLIGERHHSLDLEGGSLKIVSHCQYLNYLTFQNGRQNAEWTGHSYSLPTPY